MSRLYRGRRKLEAVLLRYGRDHGYIRSGVPQEDAVQAGCGLTTATLILGAPGVTSSRVLCPSRCDVAE